MQCLFFHFMLFIIWYPTVTYGSTCDVTRAMACGTYTRDQHHKEDGKEGLARRRIAFRQHIDKRMLWFFFY